MGQTENYGLKQWKEWEQIKRGEVNRSFGQIDTALRVLETRADVRAGTYTGDGASSQHIDVGFAPQAVLVECRNGIRSGSRLEAANGGLAVKGSSLNSTTNSWNINALQISGNGFYVSGEMGSNLNDTSQVYHYVAFR